MKRPFRRFEVLCLAAALAGGAGCTPDHSVKPGAPVLTEVAIVEGGGATVTHIPTGAQPCAATAVTGGGCDPSVDTTCFQAGINNWCRCNANPAPAAPTPPPMCDGGMGGAAAGSTGAAGAGGAGGAGGMSGAASADAGADAGVDAAAGAGGAGGAAAPTPAPGTWTCDPFGPTAKVMYVFDRLLDSRPLDPGDAGGPVAAATITAGAATIPSNADYASNGAPGTLIFPLLGDFRADGPSLVISAVPALPSSAAVTVALDGTMVRAKDGKTPFTDQMMFNGGALTFSTAAFSGSVAAPQPAPADACAPPNTTVALDATGTISFNSPVDPAALMNAVTVTMGTNTAVPFVLTSTDNMTFTVAPAAGTMWPANAYITITLPDTVADMNGEVLGAGNGSTGSFMTGAS